MAGIVVGLIAVLIVLSHLGIDTAPLIAGAGVFGLAISFGSPHRGKVSVSHSCLRRSGVTSEYPLRRVGIIPGA